MEYHGGVTPYLECWSLDFSVNKLFLSWHCDNTLVACTQAPNYCPEEQELNKLNNFPFSVKSLYFIRKELALAKKDALLTIQWDFRYCARAQHRSFFSCSRLLSSGQECRRSRDNLESKNTNINLPGQSWLKASLHKTIIEAGLLWPRKGKDGNGREGLFPVIIREVSTVYSRAERKGSPSCPSLPHLSGSSNSLALAERERVSHELQMLGHILPGVLDRQFGLPSAALSQENALSN